MIFFSHPSKIVLFLVIVSQFSTTKPLISIFSSPKKSDDLFLVLNTKHVCSLLSPSPCTHHCKNSFSSLHLFVHHCTFCASLHVRTSLESYAVNDMQSAYLLEIMGSGENRYR